MVNNTDVLVQHEGNVWLVAGWFTYSRPNISLQLYTSELMKLTSRLFF
ncbi:hypothetical protein H8S95_09470 [Pontibacter sp. KCTC 32443]|nr:MULTISPECIES: hypothetical protein [Pontibacter]MBC5774289.1 hypothetical protein [Pontibacter sp. KCTC 32443]